MGDTSEFSLTIRLFPQTYQWRKIHPVPWTPLKRPLSQCKLALVSGAGFVLPDQPHFDESIKGGDPSFREIPSGVDVKTLVQTHGSESFDHAGLPQDSNVGFPIDRVSELAASAGSGSPITATFPAWGPSQRRPDPPEGCRPITSR
jgi:D-proline reductase (dithiol) PrdB